MNKFLIAVVSIILCSVISTIVAGFMTFEGTVVKDPYVTALKWDSSHHERASSGWTVRLLTPFVRSPSSELMISVADRNGSAVKNAKVKLFLTMPSTDRFDSEYRMDTGPSGSYKTVVKAPVKGRWLARLDIVLDNRTVVFNESISVE